LSATRGRFATVSDVSVVRTSPTKVLEVLWGKSDAGGQPNLLLQHLLDTAAVAEVLWDVYLSDAVRRPLDDITRGRGRQLFALLGGWHDLGKATPGFQGKVPALAQRVEMAGLPTRVETRAEKWRHELASALIVREVLQDRWPVEHVEWFWPLLAGHHGRVPSRGKLQPKPRWMRGGEGWVAAQHALAARVADELNDDLRPPQASPTRSRQLVAVGHLVMADWIASDERHFPGVDDPTRVSITVARERARVAVAALGLRRGLRPAPTQDTAALMRRRFGRDSRPVQALVAEAARHGAGLLLVEAPTGEGKTEAALLAVELLAARSGQDGVYVGLPTQATSDPMFTRVHSWLSTFEDPPSPGLLHGKRAFNSEWAALQQRTSYAGVDDYGLADPYASPRQREAKPPADWFLGRKRGLLQPVAVGTVDQVLYAATRTKHVMLRHAGLAGGVVVLDEVHAYDVYMAQFLEEALRWAAAADVPVVLLSATLPPQARQSLVDAYAQGATGSPDATVPLGASPGYPSVLAVRREDSNVQTGWTSCAGARASRPFAVSVLEQVSEQDDAGLVELLGERLRSGGTCLVVRNTVTRAQQTYRALQPLFADDVVLLHARLTVGARTDRAETLLRELGPGEQARPARRVVVATQVAEQSFDIDADLLVTDLAPIDLLLQRAGRLHRHERPNGARPLTLRDPQVVVTGLQWQGDAIPLLPAGSRAVYGEHLLLRAAALVQAGLDRGWDLPADVPRLVAAGYARDEQVPAGWRDWLVAVRAEEDEQSERRQADARRFLLAGVRGQALPTLAGLHEMDVAEVDDDEVAAVVRDGENSVEVTLVVRDGHGYRTLDGRWLGATGEAVITDPTLHREVAACAVRLPASPATRQLNAAARQELGPLPGWADDVYLRSARALELDASGAATLGLWRLSYDAELGLLHERTSW